MAISKIPSAGFQDNVKFRNIIINGDMSIAQRGTSASGLTGSGYNTIDRFSLLNTGLGTWTQSQSTDVPSGQGFAKSMKMDCTTADSSPASGDILQIRTAFEGQNLQYLNFGTSSAKSLTLSFWVKSNKTGTYTMVFFHRDASKQFSKSYTISSANTWEKKTITVVGNTANGIDNDNAKSFDVWFNLGAGSNFTSGSLSSNWEADTDGNYAVGQVNLADSTSNEWYITGVQLEAGEVASDFEFLPHDVNLTRCERYYQTTQAFIGAGHSTSGAIIGQTTLRVKMRSTPSASQTGNFIVTDGYTNDYTQSSTNITRYGNNADTSSFMIYLANFNSAMTAAKPYFTRHSNDSVLNFSSEL